MLNSKEILYKDDNHIFVQFNFEDEEYKRNIIQTNQYLIIHKGKGVVLDPGGMVNAIGIKNAIETFIPASDIEYLFLSHQDPDVSSSLSYWLGISDARVVISSIWERFITHQGFFDLKKLLAIPDEGLDLEISPNYKLKIIPAHFLHSPGNFSLYDPKSKILFSGDIGSSVFPKGKRYYFVEDFKAHIPLIESFHKRYMASNKACQKWVDAVSNLEIDIIAPQHGAIFSKKASYEFLVWLKDLKCGIDLI